MNQRSHRATLSPDKHDLNAHTHNNTHDNSTTHTIIICITGQHLTSNHCYKMTDNYKIIYSTIDGNDLSPHKIASNTFIPQKKLERDISKTTIRENTTPYNMYKCLLHSFSCCYLMDHISEMIAHSMA